MLHRKFAYLCLLLSLSLGIIPFGQAQQNTGINSVEQVFYLNITRSDAASVLNELARQTDSVLIYSYEQARKYQANAIYGYFTLADALEYVLLNTGLSANTLSNGSIKISLAPTVPDEADSPEPIKIAATPLNVEHSPHRVEVIQIDGIRRSMYQAQDIKRQSNVILDSIVAEDIGKLPDITAAESIARLTGVQVKRFNDEVDNVLIRGLPFFTTTYNGREFFTAEQRLASLQDFPSQAIAEIEVYKSSSAELIDPGLAGLVNIRTRRPFDFEGEKIAGGLHYNYNDQHKSASPNGNLLYTNRWSSEIGEIGFLANLTYAESEFYNGVRFNGTRFPQASADWRISPEEYSSGNFVLPDTVGLYNSGGKRWRPSANFSVQLQPKDTLEIYLEGIFQGYRSNKYIDNFFVSLTDTDPLHGSPVLENVTVKKGPEVNLAQSLTKSAGRASWMYRHTAESQTDTYQYAIGMIWQDNGFKILSDLAFTDSRYFDNVWSFDSAIKAPQTLNVSFYNPAGGSFFSFEDFNALDESEYVLRGYYESRYKIYGENIQWRTDVSYTTDWDFIHAVQAGMRLASRETAREDGARYAWLLDLNLPLSELSFLNLRPTPVPYRDNSDSFSQYLAPTRSSIINNTDALANFAYQNLINLSEQGEGWRWAEQQASAWKETDIATNPITNFTANEFTYSGYLQAQSSLKVAQVNIDIMSGIRIAKTELDTSGFSAITANNTINFEETNRAQDYIDTLPNLHLTAEITEKLKLRLAYGKTITRPNFIDLNPAVAINLQLNAGVDAVGSGGNPDLKPVTSHNYDLSTEYYFSNSGFLSWAAFYRDLFGFVNSQTQTVEDPVYGKIELVRPVNSGKGKIYGHEFNFQTFFDFFNRDLKGFGFNANTTYQKGVTSDPDEAGEYTDYRELAGLSEWTHNVALFYEGESINARLSYNYRSQWVSWYADAVGAGFAGNKIRARERIDFSVSYELDPHLTLYADVNNLLAEPFKNDTYINEDSRYPQDVRYEGRYFGAGLRFNY